MVFSDHGSIVAPSKCALLVLRNSKVLSASDLGTSRTSVGETPDTAVRGCAASASHHKETSKTTSLCLIRKVT